MDQSKIDKKLNIAHINIRSCINKNLELQLFLKENNIDILTLNETRLKPNKKFEIPNYVVLRKDRAKKKGGGVTVILRKDIKFEPLTIPTPPDCPIEHRPLKFLTKEIHFQFPPFVFLPLNFQMRI